MKVPEKLKHRNLRGGVWGGGGEWRLWLWWWLWWCGGWGLCYVIGDVVSTTSNQILVTKILGPHC